MTTEGKARHASHERRANSTLLLELYVSPVVATTMRWHRLRFCGVLLMKGETKKSTFVHDVTLRSCARAVAFPSVHGCLYDEKMHTRVCLGFGG